MMSFRFFRSTLLSSFFLFSSVAAVAQSGLVISQVYGGGGNSGASYNADFIEIYNPTNAAVSTFGLSVQYASSAAYTYQAVALSSATTMASAVMIMPGHYFLVQTTTPATTGAVEPTPDMAASAPNLSGTNGKVFLVNGTAQLTDANCPALLADTKIIDFVGYGTATCYPGFNTSGYAAAPAPKDATYSDNRTNLTTNAHNNSTDFALLTPPNPHNSSFVTATSSSPTASGGASPSAVFNTKTTVLTVTVTPGTGPASTGITVTGDLRNIGGIAAQSFSNPSGDGVTFTYTATVNTSNTGPESLPITVADSQSRTGTASITVTVSALPATVAIDVIQGQKSTTAEVLSPYAGQKVTTYGVVTAVLSNGFFIQTPDASADSNPLTPEGIDVFTSSAPTVVIGNYVQVIGTVQTYPATTASHTPASEITSPTVTVQTASVALPAAITLTTSMLTPGGGLYQLTPYEGMRVIIPSFTTSSGTTGSLTESSETITSTGQFYGIITGTYGTASGSATRPFREPGIDVRDAPLPNYGLPSSQVPANAQYFDDNPERILVDTTLAGGTTLDLNTGSVLTNLTGVLDFTYSSDSFYDPSRLIVDASYNRSANYTPGFTVTTFPVPTKASTEFTVASYNIERFYNTSSADDIYAVPSPATCFPGDAVLTTSPLTCKSEAVDITQNAYTVRLKKLSLAIRTVLNSPDIITLEEVENQNVANDIASQLNTDIGTATGTNGQYVALSTDNSTYYSQDGTGISVGILYNAATVDQLGFTQIGAANTMTASSYSSGVITRSTITLNDRPWLALSAGVKRATGTKDYPVTVIVNHMKSLISQNSPTSNSTRLKKELQAELIAKYIQNLQQAGTHVISGGDFNAFEFSDNYNDTLATYTNTNVLPSNQVVQPGVSGLVTPPLTDLALTLPVAQRWSYQEDGSAQILDHMVVTPELLATGVRFAYAHNNADFALINYSDVTNAARTSDHDPAIGYFTIPAPVLAATLSPTSANFGSQVAGNASSGQQFTFTNTGEGPVTVSSVTGSGDFAASSNCTSVAINSSCTINVVFTPTTTGTRTGTLTVVANTAAGTYTSSLTGMGTGATSQTITFPQPTTGVAGSTATLTASSTSGLAITYSITSGPATVSGSTVTYTGAGSVVIAADQPGNATYAAATTVSDTVTVVNAFVWLGNATGTADKFSNAGALIAGPVGTAGAAGALGGAAIDGSGNAWLVEQGSNTLTFVTVDGSSATALTGGGLNTPTGVTIDGLGQVWETNGNGTVGLFSNAGLAQSPSTGYTGVTVSAGTGGTTGYSTPTGISVDLSGNVWVSNSGNNTVTEILGAAAPASPLATAVASKSTGVRP